jgi:choline dehydrogenase
MTSGVDASTLEGDWDYIVVGAGSAGCAVAGRLAEDPARRVLLIEAGHDGRHPLVRIPGGVRFTIGSPTHDWMLASEPDPTSHNRVHAWPRGKMVGGSSGINGMIYARGAPADYDDMAAKGMTGWSWREVLPYFMRSEDFEGGASDTHGAGGPLSVSYLRTPHLLSQVFVESCAQAGLDVVDDINGGIDTGIGYVQATQRNGARCSSADAYLRGPGRRPNLAIVTHAQVQRVLIEQQRARGVLFTQGGRLRRSQAHHEVIVCAGTIMSPHLLMHSGVGDPLALERLGLPVLTARPAVGQNFQEHGDAGLQYEVNQSTFNMKIGIFSMARYGLRWLVMRDGPVASPGAQVFGLFRSREGLARPDIGLYFQANGYRLEPGKIVFNREPTVTASVVTVDPKSRGELRWDTADANTPPRIFAQLLQSEEDCTAILSGLRLARRIMAQRAMKPYVVRELAPGAHAESDAELLEFARSVSDPVMHCGGTCRMGEDGDAVVDPQLRVRGVQGLRVADMSVTPVLPSANTNSTAIMIGERCADFILRGDRTAS